MKKRIFLMINYVVIVFILSNVSCSRDENSETMPMETELPEIVYGEGARIGTFKLPDATRISYFENSFTFYLPDGYRIAFMNDDNETVITDEGSYECTCDGNGGCTVFWHKKHGFGCLQSTCDGTCEGKEIEPQMIGTGVILDYNDPYHFVSATEDAEDLFVAKKVLFEIPEVLETIKELNLKYYGKEIITEEEATGNGSKIVALSLYGNLVGYSLPAGAKGINGPTITCECTGSGGGTSDDDCVEANRTGPVWFCPNETCSVCKMKVVQQD